MTISLGQKLGLRPGDALLVIDVQRDFLPGGSLPVAEGREVVAPLNAYIAAFSARRLPILATRDWHPPDHCSFRESGGPWPPHCVRQTPGAEWPSELRISPETHVISKATSADTEAYSGFSGTALARLLRDLKVRRLFVGGLATDYCVHDTVLDARAQGFEVSVLADAVRAVNLRPEDAGRAIEDMIAHGASWHA